MKAVVVEIKNNKAAVLSENGCVVTVKNNGYEIGQVIHMIDSKVRFSKKIAIFAASAALVILGTGTWAYATPYTYVSVDVNPSIEYTVNRFDRVLSVKAINDDGEEILQEIALDNLENKTIEDAIARTVEQITAAGYFNSTTEGGIIITTASENEDKAKELAADLQQAVEGEVAKSREDIIVEAFSVGLERVREAKELGVTPGKLNLIEKLQSSSIEPSSIDIEQWLSRSVKDIMKATKDNRKAFSVSGSAITMKENSDRDTRGEKSEVQKQQKVEQKLQKEVSKQKRDEQKQQKDELKQQKDELKQQKDESKQQKDELRQQRDELKQQKDESKQQKEEEKSINKSKTSQKGTKTENSTFDKKEQQSSEDKKDKATSQSSKDKEKASSTNGGKSHVDEDSSNNPNKSDNSGDSGNSHDAGGSSNSGNSRDRK